MRVRHKIAVLGTVVVAVTALGMSSALADPSPLPPWPSLTDIVGVGSDTTTPVMGQLSSDYNAQAGSGPKLYSWDAVNPSTGVAHENIITKASDPTDNPPTDITCQITRPDGSSEGITALENTASDQSNNCVDFARSSRAPASTDPDTIAFAVMAGDAITWATPGGGSPAPSTLTLTDLLNIYNCTYTNWDQVPGDSNNSPIVAVLPQSGSGTRATFLLALGELNGGTSPLTPGSCVVNGTDANGDVIEENTGVTVGNQTEFGTVASPNPNVIFPYSIGAFIAQGPAANGVGGHATSIWAQGPMVLHSVTDDGGTVQAPTTTNANGGVVINQAFPAELQRVLYNVVPNGGTPSAPAFPAAPAALNSIFGASGYVCTNTTAQNDLVSYGFYQEPNCGQLTDHFLIYG